jgi:hypothetical protein
MVALPLQDATRHWRAGARTVIANAAQSGCRGSTLVYSGVPRRGAPPLATRGPDVLQSQQKRKHSVRQVPQWLEMCLQLLPE